MTSAEQLNIKELILITDVLLGAAHADGEDGSIEIDVIEDILKALVHGQELPDELTEHIVHFEPGAYDLYATCSQLHLATAEDRRTLLALVAEVTDADDIHDLEEDRYIRQVAEAIGAAPEEYADLTVEVLQISSIQGSATPPPIPMAALETSSDDGDAPDTELEVQAEGEA